MTTWRQLTSVIILAAGLSGPAWAAEPDLVLPPLRADSLEAKIESLLVSPELVADRKLQAADKDDIAGAKAFYAHRRYGAIWVEASGLNSNAKRVIGEIGKAGDWGLRTADFALPDPKTSSANEGLAQVEITLTRAVLKYARHARGGRIGDPSAELSAFIDRKPPVIAPQTVLEQIAAAPAAGAYLSGLHPRHAQFEKLRQAYLKARSDRGRAANMKLPEGPILKPGQSHPNVAILRKRLAVPALTDQPGMTNLAEFYDPALVAAVQSFQTKAGLRRADGMVGEKTRFALNAEGDSKVPTLLANMEQWRWMPEQLGDTHVIVNIPEFQMRLVKGGAVVHAERVITGKPDTATPIFSDMMQTVVFQPKWGVPESIKVNELLPRLQRGGGLRSGLKMSLNGRDVDPWNVDWNRADIRRYHIYQPSGDDNALGVVKFLFPNKHAVYMHDTPTKKLFNAATRAYSHGCIRVRDPVRLAELVLGADKGWNKDLVRELTEDGPEDNAIKLEAKIPVHITYFTAVVDDAGNVQTFADIYGHEKRIGLAIEGRKDLIAKLDPAPIGSPRGAAAGDDALPPARWIRSADGGRYVPPAALGYLPPPKQPGFSFFAPVSKPSSGGGRFRGGTTNDIIMRQLGGF